MYTTGGIAVRRGTDIVEGGSRPLLPNWRVYDLLKVGKSVDVLRPTSMRFERQNASKVK